jgi:uncharacterized protein YbaR (Trm112 family)
MTAQKGSTPAGSRDSKRARFAAERSHKEQRGASPLVLAGGILVTLALIAGAVFAAPGLTSDRTTTPFGQAQNAGVQSNAEGLTAGQAAATPSLGSDPAAASQVTAPTRGHDPYPLVVAEDGAVRLPASTFDDNRSHFYTYIINGQPVEFFVVKSQDGVIHAAFNACDVCFPAKLGYHQEGDEMVCNNCGRRFPIDQINQVRGGCNPSSLEQMTLGDMLIIPGTDLAQGLGFF